MKQLRIENYLRIIPGVIVFISSFLGFFYSKYWLLITMFVGLNLFQFGFTNKCPMVNILKRLGLN